MMRHRLLAIKREYYCIIKSIVAYVYKQNQWTQMSVNTIDLHIRKIRLAGGHCMFHILNPSFKQSGEHCWRSCKISSFRPQGPQFYPGSAEV